MSEAREAVRRQLDLEAEAYSLGETRYRQSRPMPWRYGDEPATTEEEANLPPGQALIKAAVVPTAELLQERIDKANNGAAGRRHAAIKWLESADLKEVAYLAARTSLNCAAARAKLQTVAIEIADVILYHLEMRLLAGKNKAGYVGLVRSQHGRKGSSSKRAQAIRKLLSKEGARLEVPTKERLHLGTFVFEALSEATGFFVADLMKVNAKDRMYVVTTTEAIEKWLDEQHARCSLLNPAMLPMVVRPRRWRSTSVGGYLSNGHGLPRGKHGRVPGMRLVKAPGKDYKRRLDELDLSKVFEAVNHIQETPWQINRPILEIMREVWDTGGSLAGLPPREDRALPARPEDIDTNEQALKRWKREAALVHEDNANQRARRLGVQQKLWIAERFVEEPAIWFPHNLDFRGRVYPMPAMGVHPQADDAGKALLRFAEGHALGEAGAYWLSVHLANLFGVDKVSFQERVAWTWAHAAEIIDSAVNPLDGNRFWTTAESPWMALAACLEFAGFLDQGEAFVSHLPIPLDGSNSGLQHFSALLRDPIGGAAVNLLPADEPQDVYRAVAKRAQEIVDADPAPEAEPWKNGKVTRSIAKRPTMTFVYSATRFGMQDMILQTLREVDRSNEEAGEPPHLGGADNYPAAHYLSHVLFGAISEVVSAAKEAMAWLREVAKAASEAGVSLEWTTPDGLLVRQAYRVTYGDRVVVHWQGRRLTVTLAVESSELDGRGQANGIAPNYVHSLDGAHLRAVSRGAAAAGIESLAVIHDSFGTHAGKTDELVKVLRDTFVEQYRHDHLEELYHEIRHQLPEPWASQVPPPPKKGNLDLDQVKLSRYLFA